MKFGQFTMRNRHDQIEAVTPEERKRRFGIVRRIMKEKDIAVFLLPDCSDSLGPWLCGTEYPSWLILPEEGELLKFYPKGTVNADTCAFIPEKEDPVGMCRWAVKEDWSQVARLAALHGGRIGVAALHAMDVQLYETLKAIIPGFEPVDIGDDIHLEKAKKSLFEQGLVWESARMHQKILEAVPSILRPGRTMKEVSDEIRYLALQFGSTGEDMCLMIHTQTLDGEPLDEQFEPYPGRRFGREDLVSVLLETNGPGGFYHALGRYFAFQKPSETFLKRYKTALEANHLAGRLMCPGNSLRNAADTVNQFIRGCGYYTDDCCYMHGMGYTMWEYPALADNTYEKNYQVSEDMPLTEGMISLAHPHVGYEENRYTPREAMVRCIDSYIVKEGGAVRGTGMTQDIILI